MRRISKSRLQQPSLIRRWRSRLSTTSRVVSTCSMARRFTTGRALQLLCHRDTYLTSDVDYFWTYYAIQLTGTLTNICVDGCTSTLDYEPTLDVEYAGAQAPGANLLVYETPTALFSDLSLMYSQIASDNSAQVVSISWGGCESTTGNSVMKTQDASFAQMASE